MLRAWLYSYVAFLQRANIKSNIKNIIEWRRKAVVACFGVEEYSRGQSIGTVIGSNYSDNGHQSYLRINWRLQVGINLR